jgi:ATP diphosphatase
VTETAQITETAAIARLLELMRRLRDPVGGCPWDRAQSFATLAPFAIEEAHELADAIEGGDPAQIRGELGDLLFQVVFHAELARERGWFDFEAVAGAIVEKLTRRHPHVFGEAQAPDAATVARAWETIKAAERAERADRSALADVPRALPALSRARKLGARAARVHFDFPDARAARAKVLEEIEELDAVVAAEANCGDERGIPVARAAEEFGDLLFSVVNWGRHLALDAEASLRAASLKFERRFRAMEALATERGLELDRLSATAWDALWTEVK